jgi:hypothetical protein
MMSGLERVRFVFNDRIVENGPATKICSDFSHNKTRIRPTNPILHKKIFVIE